MDFRYQRPVRDQFWQHPIADFSLRNLFRYAGNITQIRQFQFGDPKMVIFQIRFLNLVHCVYKLP